MTDLEAPGRRELMATLAKWSGAALSIAGLGGVSTGCGGHSSSPRPAPPYSDYADYANYFDYSNYANYGNYVNGPYGDYSDYADYANYGDYFDYQDRYADAYADAYSDYANYADYSDYNDYSDYSDYEDYADYSDDSGDPASAPARKAPPRGGYADYADVYADAGAGPSMGRARVVRPPFHGVGEGRREGGAAGVRGPAWSELPAERLPPAPEASGANLHGVAHQGLPGELKRPERQKDGRRSRTPAGPSNRKARP